MKAKRLEIFISRNYMINNENRNEAIRILTRALCSLHVNRFLKSFWEVLDYETEPSLENFNAIIHHNNPSELISTFYKLYDAGILNQNNFDIIVAQDDPNISYQIMIILHDCNIFTQVNFYAAMAKKDLTNNIWNFHRFSRRFIDKDKILILNQDHFDAIINHEDQSSLCCALDELHRKGILEEYENYIIVHEKPISLARAFIYLHQTGILNHMGNINILITHKNIENLALVLGTLYSVGLLKQENFDEFKSYDNLRFINTILNYYRRGGGVLNQIIFITIKDLCEYRIYFVKNKLMPAFERIFKNKFSGIPIFREYYVFEYLIEHQRPYWFADALSTLFRVGLLNRENVDLVKNSSLPNSKFNDFLAEALANLQKAGIYQENRNIVISHKSPYELAKSFVYLHKAGILNKENKNIILTYQDKKVMFAIYMTIEKLYKSNRLNQENFNLLIENPVTFINESKGQQLYERPLEIGSPIHRIIFKRNLNEPLKGVIEVKRKEPIESVEGSNSLNL